MGEAFFWWTGEGFGLRVAAVMVPVGVLCWMWLTPCCASVEQTISRKGKCSLFWERLA